MFGLLLLVHSLSAQVRILENRDSLSYEFLKPDWPYNLKDTLPDGEYFFVQSPRNRKERRQTYQERTLIHGQYKDSLKTGQWLFYTYCYVGKWGREVRVQTGEENYKEGKLDGYFVVRSCGAKVLEGYYKEGKKHGFWYYYYDIGKFDYVELYIDGNMLCRSDASEPTRILEMK